MCKAYGSCVSFQADYPENWVATFSGTSRDNPHMRGWEQSGKERPKF